MVVEAQKAPAAPAAAADRGRRKVEVGTVVSARMAKTIAVSMDRTVRHPKFEKSLTRQTILKAHDEKSEARVGDLVEVVETRPLSKTKRWRLVRVVRKTTVATVTGALDAGDQSKAKGGHKGKGEKAESEPAKVGEAPKAASREPGKK